VGATIALMVFFLTAGFTAWLLNETPSTAAVPPAAHSDSSTK
jgi:hypothetical protein